MNAKCKKYLGSIILWTWLAGSYPFSLVAMSNGWGFYEKNPQPNVTPYGRDVDEWSKKEIVAARIVLFVVSPLSTPVNGLYMMVESTIEE